MDRVSVEMTVPFRRLLVHWRSLVIVLVPLVLSPLVVIGSKVCILNVTRISLFLAAVKSRRMFTVNNKEYSPLNITSVVIYYAVSTVLYITSAFDNNVRIT